MKNLKYIGRFSGIDIDGIGTVMRGETAEVPGDLAKKLLKRPSEWELAHEETSTQQEEMG